MTERKQVAKLDGDERRSDLRTYLDGNVNTSTTLAFNLHLLSPPVLRKRAKRSERSTRGGRLSGKRARAISRDNIGCKTRGVILAILITFEQKNDTHCYCLNT